MSLYLQVDSNIRKTWLLLSVFLVLVIVLGWLFSYLLNSPVILIIAIVFSLATSLASYWFSDKIVLSAVRAKPIEKKDNPELYRIVENLCLTAGIPLPKVYILNEEQPNAFATGRNEKHAAVAITKGLLEKLNRSELEGVIAHELSHIKNKDMLLQTMVVVLAGIIAAAANLFLRFSFWGGIGGRRDSENTNGVLLLVLGIIAAILAPLAATIVQLAISRKREFLADASGVLLTRYPEGLARALAKISADPAPMRRASNSTAHLFIASPFKGRQRRSWFTKLFMTHPPVEERIKALKAINV